MNPSFYWVEAHGKGFLWARTSSFENVISRGYAQRFKDSHVACMEKCDWVLWWLLWPSWRPPNGDFSNRFLWNIKAKNNHLKLFGFSFAWATNMHDRVMLNMAGLAFRYECRKRLDSVSYAIYLPLTFNRVAWLNKDSKTMLVVKGRCGLLFNITALELHLSGKLNESERSPR